MNTNVVNPSTTKVYTVAFSGTGHTRDDGEVSNLNRDKRVYSPRSGYIPIRILKEVNNTLLETDTTISIRGSGQNDWALPRNNSEPLLINGLLKVPNSLTHYAKPYSAGNQYSSMLQVEGTDIAALALHAANKVVASDAKVVNMIGHSRGAVTALITAWFIYSYGPKDIQVNIFAIDPVPGPGDWWSNFTTLAPNVNHYAAIYAWDTVGEVNDAFYTALVPYPNEKMLQVNQRSLINNIFSFNTWKNLGDKVNTPDPLGESNEAQPLNYDLFLCRGRHGTVSGNITTDSGGDPLNNSSKVSAVADLVYLMARTYLTQWGTVFTQSCAVSKSSYELRTDILESHDYFDAMGAGAYRTSKLTGRPYVRRVSSSSGFLLWNKSYLEDVVGDPPYEQYYPVTEERAGNGWVKWNFL